MLPHPCQERVLWIAPPLLPVPPSPPALHHGNHLSTWINNPELSEVQRWSTKADERSDSAGRNP
jgi:hypothetical protein